MGDMGTPALNVSVVVLADTESDDEEADRLARRLRSELAGLDTDSVTMATGGAAPPGAKGVDAASVGAIVVALSASGGLFPTMIETIRDWLGRQSGRHRVAVTIDGDTIELESATAAQQRTLVDAYVKRHASP
jgi:hypothetical protein